MKVYFLLFIMAFCSCSFAQNSKTKDNLVKYFVGIPIRESFENWVRFISTHPYLGFDSINSRGAYSSFKPGINSYFPFRETKTVKILIQKIVYYDSLTDQSTDSVNEISIEGVYSDNKNGRKTSVEVYKDLRKVLRVHYRLEDFQYFENGRSSSLRKGKNTDFPDCILQQAHSKELGFYFVMITYISPRKKLHQ